MLRIISIFDSAFILLKYILTFQNMFTSDFFFSPLVVIFLLLWLFCNQSFLFTRNQMSHKAPIGANEEWLKNGWMTQTGPNNPEILANHFLVRAVHLLTYSDTPINRSKVLPPHWSVSGQVGRKRLLRDRSSNSSFAKATKKLVWAEQETCIESTRTMG